MIYVSFTDERGLPRVRARHDEGQRAEVLSNADYAGAQIWSHGGRLDYGEVIPSQATLLNAPRTLAQYARQRGYEVEVGGIDFAGLRIATDRLAQGLIDRAINLFEKDEELESVLFDTGGDPLGAVDPVVEIDRATMTQLGLAVGRHVQGAFRRRGEALRAIRAGTVADEAGVDAVLAGAA